MSKSSANMATCKATRKANWSEKEVQCLVSECTDNYNLITAKHSDGHSEGTKSNFWKELCERINSQGGSGRSVEEIMKKWKDLKSQTKKKEQTNRREMKKTGGGGAVCSLKDWEEKIITIIPSSVLDGNEGGMDLFHRNEETVIESAETVIKVGGEETVVIHPSSIHVQGECLQEKLEIDMEPEKREMKKRKRTLNELESAQLQFYQENAELCRAQKKVAIQQLSTMAAQEEFYRMATSKLKEKDEMASFLKLFSEQ